MPSDKLWSDTISFMLLMLIYNSDRNDLNSIESEVRINYIIHVQSKLRTYFESII